MQPALLQLMRAGLSLSFPCCLASSPLLLSRYFPLTQIWPRVNEDLPPLTSILPLNAAVGAYDVLRCVRRVVPCGAAHLLHLIAVAVAGVLLCARANGYKQVSVQY